MSMMCAPDSDVPPENIDRFGEIQVQVYWAVEDLPVKKESHHGEDSDEKDFEILSRPVDEKFKLIQHRFAAGLGEPVIEEDPGRWGGTETTAVDQNEEFWFHFLYRDIEWLKMEGIAPKNSE
ncbi:hypothetical protein FS749_009813 [Ceratobasidium sp. UAMH 11750]|nr:hypothetical protein FS749_009813 [Ceratobasidium sp. UAMH 11750]